MRRAEQALSARHRVVEGIGPNVRERWIEFSQRARLSLDDDLAVFFREWSDFGWGRISRTASEGRQSQYAFGVMTIGRLMRIGCPTISSSVNLEFARPIAS